MFAIRDRAGQADGGRMRWRALLFIQALECRHAPAQFTVNTITDTGAGSGLTGDLRYCIAQADSNPGADTITFALGGPATITLNGTQLTLSDKTGATTIAGPGAKSLTINANQKSRVLNLAHSVTANIDGVTITGGNVGIGFAGGGIALDFRCALILTNSTLNLNSAPDGGGIYASALSKVNLTNSTLSGNSAVSLGGGICTDSSTTVTLVNSTFTGNSAGGNGGCIFTSSNNNVTVTNSTFSGNSAKNSGGVILNGGTLMATNSTFSGNSAASGGAIANFKTLTLNNSIVAGNSAASNADILGTFSQTNSLLNISAPAAGLGTLGNYGGPTQTIPLLPGSPAIDKGTTLASIITDQRGIARQQGIAFDIGAFEYVFSPSLIVTTTADEDNGTSDPGFGFGTSLREAINYANVHAGADIITFALGGAATITLNGTPLPALTDAAGATTISGPGAKLLTLDGSDKSRILVVNNGSAVTISGVTITSGKATGNGGAISADLKSVVTLTNSTLLGNSAPSGGGISVRGGSSVTLNDSTVSGNSATALGGAGGGIFADTISSVTLIACTLSGNVAGNVGGGIYARAQVSLINSTLSNNSAGSTGGGISVIFATLTITNSTISGNSAYSLGGGIVSHASTLTISHATITNNSTKTSGGGISFFGFMTLTNTIVAGNSAPTDPDILGTGAFNQTNSLINMSAAAAGLGTLGNYGGSTQTIPLLPGSPAIDAGNSTITMDQRGLSRFGAPDIGAFESQGFMFTTTGSGQTAFITTMFANPLAVTVTANNPVEPVDGGLVTFTPPISGASAVLSGSTITLAGGKAAVTATANNMVGKYNVTAASGGLLTNFALANGGPTNLASLSFVGGNLSASFGNQGNIIEVFGQTGAVTVRSNYTVVGTYAVTGIITVGGGSGADTFTLTVNSGAAFPSLVTVNAVGGDDEVNIGSSTGTPGTIPNLTLILGEGNNKVIDNGFKVTNSWTLNAGAGNDTIGPLTSPVGTLLSITAGNGDNTASIFSKVTSQVRYIGGIGKDNVTVGGLNSYGLYVYLGAGSDTLTFAPGSAIGGGIIDFGGDADSYAPNGVFVGSGLTVLNLP